MPHASSPASIAAAAPAHIDLRPLLIVAAGLAAAADWLFYHRDLGISVAVFVLILAVAIVSTNRARIAPRWLAAGAVLLLAALLPVVEDVSLLSILFALLGSVAFALVVTDHLSPTWLARSLDALTLALSGPIQFCEDAIAAQQHAANHSRTGGWFRNLAVWVVPVVLGSLFVALFAIANPLLSGWLSQIELRHLFAHLDPVRAAFWSATALMSWSFLRVRKQTAFETAPARTSPAAPPTPASPGKLFGDAAILRSLIVFNLIFAGQTAMDAVYLWGGAALPDGMTLATYAHRGAYPLLVTALLAAAFVVLAMKPGAASAEARSIRALVYLWVGQNVLLVLSSIFRLNLYVEIYTLTYWRLAAIIWMGLVALGLVLILVQILWRRSRGWLIAANVLTLALTLYACCFVNFPHVIATYNVTHSGQVAGKATLIDACYLYGLGPQALVAIDRLRRTGADPYCPAPTVPPSPLKPDKLVAAHLASMQDWRAQTFRAWRLSQYLATRPTP